MICTVDALRQGIREALDFRVGDTVRLETDEEMAMRTARTQLDAAVACGTIQSYRNLWFEPNGLNPDTGEYGPMVHVTLVPRKPIEYIKFERRMTPEEYRRLRNISVRQVDRAVQKIQPGQTVWINRSDPTSPFHGREAIATRRFANDWELLLVDTPEEDADDRRLVLPESELSHVPNINAVSMPKCPLCQAGMVMQGQLMRVPERYLKCTNCGHVVDMTMDQYYGHEPEPDWARMRNNDGTVQR